MFLIPTVAASRAGKKASKLPFIHSFIHSDAKITLDGDEGLPALFRCHHFTLLKQNIGAIKTEQKKMTNTICGIVDQTTNTQRVDVHHGANNGRGCVE